MSEPQIAFLLLAILCPSVTATLEISGDLDNQLGRLFWMVFIMMVFGFFIYLFCTYPAPDPPPPRRQSERNVVNVRILNLQDLLKSNGRALPSEFYPPA
jgi:hypothetical protein